jgi:Protein of unknown function (DUF1761)
MTPAPRNPLAIALASLLYFILGGIWFTVLKDAWLTGVGRTVDELMKTGVSPAVSFGVAIVTTIIIAIGLDWVIRTTGPQTLARGITIAVAVWFAFVFTTFAAEYAFELRSIKALAIVAGYPLVAMVLAGAVLGAWKKKLPA